MQPQDAWIETGDRALQEPDGSWTIEGRVTEVFKRHGEKVSAQLILRALKETWNGELSSYRDVDSLGEDGFVVVLAPLPTPDDLRGILDLLRTRFRRAQWPLRIETMTTMPRLPNGKIDLLNLKEGACMNPIWRQRV